MVAEAQAYAEGTAHLEREAAGTKSPEASYMHGRLGGPAVSQPPTCPILLLLVPVTLVRFLPFKHIK